MESMSAHNYMEPGFRVHGTVTCFGPGNHRSRYAQEVRGSPLKGRKKKNKVDRMVPYMNLKLIHEALGFVIRSAQIRGSESTLLCSRYVFTSCHAESFKKSMALLKELGYIESRDRNCAKVCDSYYNLQGLEFAIKQDFNIRQLPSLPALNTDHYLVSGSLKPKTSDMLHSIPQQHEWTQSENESNDRKNVKLLELCKIVYDLENESKDSGNEKESDKPVTENRDIASEPSSLKFILNNHNQPTQELPTLPPLKDLCDNMPNMNHMKMPEVSNTKYPFQPMNYGLFAHNFLQPFGSFPIYPIPEMRSDMQPLRPTVFPQFCAPQLDKSSSESDSHSTTDENQSSRIDSDSKESSERSVSHRTRKSRRTVNNDEREVLEKFYTDNPYPSRQKYDEIRKRLGWNSSRRVTKWFNNRRYNEKNKH